VQFGNGTDFVPYRPMPYRVGETMDSVVVPAGFVTDYASTPQFAQLGISKMGAHMLPAIVHDYLYWTRASTRRQADGIFRLAMIEMQVPSMHRQAMYRAVDVGGQAAWDSNGEQRAAGLTRIVLLERGLREPGRLETCSAYQRLLLGSGATAAREPTPVITPGCCARGRSANVPGR
jgi:hypothetical protein